MSSKRRQRELARAKHERQQARRAAEQARRRRIWTIVGAVAGVAVVLGVVVWAGLGQRGSESAADPTPTPTGTTQPSPDPTASPSVSPSGSASPSPTGSSSPTPAIDCSAAQGSRPDDKSWPSAPPNELKPGTYTMALDTNCGQITIALDAATAPQTVNSMVFLTGQGFYDRTACHRLTTEGIFVLQCGDPKGNGSGGPGYTVPDENLPPEGANNYPAGTVAMANAGPGTSGSQFFIVYKDTTLPPNYTIWGTVTSGLDVVQGVAAAGVKDGGADGAPAQPITIATATTTYKAAS